MFRLQHKQLPHQLMPGNTVWSIILVQFLVELIFREQGCATPSGLHLKGADFHQAALSSHDSPKTTLFVVMFVGEAAVPASSLPLIQVVELKYNCTS